jgi:hypothetical protein
MSETPPTAPTVPPALLSSRAVCGHLKLSPGQIRYLRKRLKIGKIIDDEYHFTEEEIALIKAARASSRTR